jgi:Tfp pilus assembly protein PilX
MCLKDSFLLGTHRQQGFALVVALLLMVALSLVGVAALRNVSLQERTAGNQYFRSISLNEARSVMRTIEQKYHSEFGISSIGNVPEPVSGATSWTTIDQAAAGAAVWSKAASWTGKEAFSTPIATGLVAQWTSDDVAQGKIRDESCEKAASGGGASVDPCGAFVIRQTVRADDPQTGAAVAIQQHFKYIDKDDLLAPPTTP